MRRLLRAGVKHNLPEGYPVDIHFKPQYNPWDQRLCVVPDGDLFAEISAGRASVVTDRIKTLTEHGIELESGRELEGGRDRQRDGPEPACLRRHAAERRWRAVELPQTLAYKGMMLSDVPNFAFAVGYTNSSWTLKVDLVCEHFARLLAYMDEHGYDTLRGAQRRSDDHHALPAGPRIRLRAAVDARIPAPGLALSVGGRDELRPGRRKPAQPPGRGSRR